ncbi:peroxidase family protein [Bdellovibrio sp. KM01]|uniref:peroxidase family protein n=1 Tax=Bdellovibrio sp. KM01 TaxID=2748865 RepID=UPI0015E8F224|nr:peroxidase family protein [Bdellovibrio sp. KM01]QLY24721.1 hypothetical protein HW988_14875 [Bdellovibrio sp. KM01]
MNQKGILSVLISSSMVLSSCTHGPVNPGAKYIHDTSVPAMTDEERRAPSSSLADTPWTTWSEKNEISGLLVLKKVRDSLLAGNLHDPHVGYFGYAPIDCSKTNTNFRSADGSCTDLKDGHIGAAGVAFGRNVSPDFIDKDAPNKIMVPNPALVSKEFFTRDEFKPVPFLNMIAGVWIQFMNHDWLTHGPNKVENPYRVKGPDGVEHIVDRTKDNSSTHAQYKDGFDKVSANDVSHWWDASQIYGSNKEDQLKLRTGYFGKMKTETVNGRELLPRDNSLNPANNRQNNGYEATGFRDNWWVGLSMLHTLFVKEHNAIANRLMAKHVTYDAKTKMYTWKNGSDVRQMNQQQMDEQVFQTARLINSAVLAKIHTVEWTPAILPNPVLRRAMYSNWYGLANPETWSRVVKLIPGMNKADIFKGVKESYVVGGIVGGKANNYGVPFSITEEFTSVYRLHSLLPENLEFRTLAQPKKVEAVPFPNTRNHNSYGIMASHDLKDLYYSFGVQHPGQLVLNNFPKFMQELEIPGHQKMDLALVDVMRDRERGVPRYNQFRRGIGLKPIKKYTDFFPAGKPLDARQLAIRDKFYSVYGRDANGNDNVELIDLLVGTCAEEVRPAQFGFGETMFQIFILMASRRLMADRFFTDDYNAAHYTTTGMEWIDDEGTLAKVIGRHMPELKGKMKGLTSAFEPWHN